MGKAPGEQALGISPWCAFPGGGPAYDRQASAWLSQGWSAPGGLTRNGGSPVASNLREGKEMDV